MSANVEADHHHHGLIFGHEGAPSCYGQELAAAQTSHGCLVGGGSSRTVWANDLNTEALYRRRIALFD